MLRKKTQGGHCAPTLLHGATNVVKKDTRGCIAPPSPPLFLMLQQMLQEKLKGGHRDLPSFSCYNKQCEKKHNVPPYSSYCIKCYQKKTQGGAWSPPSSSCYSKCYGKKHKGGITSPPSSSWYSKCYEKKHMRGHCGLLTFSYCNWCYENKI